MSYEFQSLEPKRTCHANAGIIALGIVLFIGGESACDVGNARAQAASEANTPDITLQAGRWFSVYAPSSCRRAEQSNFAMVLNCDFRGKAVTFYMKEFPGQLGDEFDPRILQPSKSNQEAYFNSAARAVVDEIDPAMRSHLRFLSSQSVTGENVDAHLWQRGYLFGENAYEYDTVKKCYFLGMRTYRRGLSAVLFAVSDIDRLVLVSASLECRGLPEEVATIVGSLGWIFEGGRRSQRIGESPLKALGTRCPLLAQSGHSDSLSENSRPSRY